MAPLPRPGGLKSSTISFTMSGAANLSGILLNQKPPGTSGPSDLQTRPASPSVSKPSGPVGVNAPRTGAVSFTLQPAVGVKAPQVGLPGLTARDLEGGSRPQVAPKQSSTARPASSNTAIANPPVLAAPVQSQQDPLANDHSEVAPEDVMEEDFDMSGTDEENYWSSSVWPVWNPYHRCPDCMDLSW